MLGAELVALAKLEDHMGALTVVDTVGGGLRGSATTTPSPTTPVTDDASAPSSDNKTDDPANLPTADGTRPIKPPVAPTQIILDGTKNPPIKPPVAPTPVILDGTKNPPIKPPVAPTPVILDGTKNPPIKSPTRPILIPSKPPHMPLVGGCAGTRFGCCEDKQTAKKDREGLSCIWDKKPLTAEEKAGINRGCIAAKDMQVSGKCATPIGQNEDISGKSYCCPDPPAPSTTTPGGTPGVPCNAGTAGAPGACFVCVAGKYSTDNAPVCKDCDVGKYNDAAGQSTCKAVEAGSTTVMTTDPVTGQQVMRVVRCAAGTYSAGGTGCKLCAVGKWASVGATACTFCPAGKTVAVGPAGKGAWSCMACVAGKFAPAGGVCTSCMVGMWALSGAGACTKCAAGFTVAAGAGTEPADCWEVRRH